MDLTDILSGCLEKGHSINKHTYYEKKLSLKVGKQQGKHLSKGFSAHVTIFYNAKCTFGSRLLYDLNLIRFCQERKGGCLLHAASLFFKRVLISEPPRPRAFFIITILGRSTINGTTGLASSSSCKGRHLDAVVGERVKTIQLQHFSFSFLSLQSSTGF